ncbi:MAG: undecaprenyldiphospho-muramoylpentapeptide beta-N-acetylglucosaminyltransferase [Eubacteriales bacterium]|nr:undecaprenyldiphospho-muramoylpentapeptide beta-N-acetylglucosaminyltransferase [Eubacteriales bacterium]
MRVIMTGGGTGGHVNPALAIADTIRQNEPDSEIIFVGTRHGKETELVPHAGYRLEFVEIQGISRSLSPKNIKTAWYILTAPRKAERLIREFRPDVVVGTGGYACWPTLKAAARLGIPTAVHESNALPGLAVRKLQNRVDRILINFEQTRRDLTAPDEKIIRVGNPLRGGFGAVTSQQAKDKLGINRFKHIVICLGGSLGAATLNKNGLRFMKQYAAKHPDMLYVHASGVRFYDQMKAEYDAAGLSGAGNIMLCDYLHDMHLWMAAADIVISRAGAMTISELSLMKKACILIPSPNVADDHQYKNARMLGDANAAIVIRDSELDDEQRYTREVAALLDDGDRRAALACNIAAFADRDANRCIYEELKKLVRERNAAK